MCRDCARITNIVDLAVRWRRGMRTALAGSSAIAYMALVEAVDEEISRRELDETQPHHQRTEVSNGIPG